MAIQNPKIFGLDVNRLFADVRDKKVALSNINLPPNDLEIIFGSAAAGAQLADWRSFSRLTEPLHETLDRFNKDSSVFSALVSSRAGTDGALFGNLKINGALSGSAIRYRYLDGIGASAPIKFADISTSRISAWSSSDPRATNSDPTIQGRANISYGARVKIVSGGKLEFGTPVVTGPRLQTSIVPQAKEFASEFPTHKITTTIGGSTVKFYAMKGIPVIFKGFFRSLNATIKLTQLINNTSASWKIVETGNANAYSNYANIGGTTSSISYRSSISRERFIQFYYNPDNILEATITSANISELPAVKFSNATRLDFSYNNLRNFPDINFIAPNISQLLLRRNPFYLSETESERKLQNTSYNGTSQTTGTVLDKIPTTVRELYLEGSFNGSITQNIFANRFTQLTVFDIGRGGGVAFHPDSVGSSVLPNVPNTIETYSIQSNDFRSIDSSAAGTGNIFNVTQLTNLVSLNLSSNYYLGGAFEIAAGNTVISSVNISGTGLPFPQGLAGKNSLESFSAVSGRGVGTLIDLPAKSYVFDNCTNLKSLNLYQAGLSGSRFPIFTNPSLTYLDLRYTGIRGGGYNGSVVDDSNVIPRKTFQFATNLTALYIDSGNLLTAPIDFNALTDLTNLTNFIYRSYGRTGGAIPSFQGNPNLTSISAYQNAFVGSPPSLASNPNISYANFSFNKLNGTIPTYQNLTRLRYLYLHSNQLTNIGEFINLPALQYLYIQDNLIGQVGSAEIPDLSDCPSLRYFTAYNNQFKYYKPGAFTQLYTIRFIDLSDNPLTEQAMEKMLEDLYTNYQSVKRGGVTVNLRGCGVPSELGLEFVVILRSKGWSITID